MAWAGVVVVVMVAPSVEADHTRFDGGRGPTQPQPPPHCRRPELWGSLWVSRRGANGDRRRMTTDTQTLTDVHDMVVVHKAFRRELRLIPELVRAVPAGDTTRAAVVAGHARLVLQGLHLHHTGEDELLWPKLLQRDAPD